MIKNKKKHCKSEGIKAKVNLKSKSELNIYLGLTKINREIES